MPDNQEPVCRESFVTVPERVVAAAEGLVNESDVVKGTSLWRDAWRRLLRNKLAVAGMFFIIFVGVMVTIVPPIITRVQGFDYATIPAEHEKLKAIAPLRDETGKFAWTHPMGTDDKGRDLLLRVLIGGRISLLVGIIATLVSMIIGVSYGAVSGYFGGRVDNLMMRIVDILYALPYIMIVIVLLSFFGGGKLFGSIAGNSAFGQLILLFIALGAVSWLTMARIVRGQIVSLKNQEFVQAARATGVSTPRIIFRHLVPNALSPVIVYATLTIPSVMLQEAFLSFLGIGVQSPLASWGSLADEGIKAISVYPWLLICPGLAMALTLLALNFFGDGLRDALDPQMRKE